MPNPTELAQIAQEPGAEILEGDLTYPSPTGGWQRGTSEREGGRSG